MIEFARIRRITPVVAAFVGLLPCPALAWDWSLSSTMSETVEFNDNLFMRNMLAGGTFGSYTTVTANAVAVTPTSRLTVDSDVGYRKYWGGTNGTTQTESDWVGVTARYETQGKVPGDKNFLDGSFRRSSAVVAVLGDLGLPTTVHGDVNRTAVRGGIQRSLSALDTVSFSLGSVLTAYDPASSGTQFTDSTASASWSHRIDPLTTVSVSSQAEWLNYDSTPRSNIVLVTSTAGFESSFSPVFSYGMNAGAVYATADAGTPAFPLGSPARPIVAGGSSVGFVANAHAIYRITKNTTLNVLAAQTTSPAITGALTKRTTLRAGVTRTINARSSISVAGDISRQTSSGATNDFVSGSVSYAYQLARDWNASLTYRYLHRTATTGSVLLDPLTGLPLNNGGAASSNSLMVTVAKTATIIPLDN
ncbi:hypothetical protein [Bradyrhizobium sp. STM 3809]|uniref:hypothetical protein n=1 Tax=Bradyrhizobium sp. STM 3809 TaxID=551936 RepID=UPI0003097599|nr:hypothetical protein [Bradyrhizobium sp. STM 3809]